MSLYNLYIHFILHIHHHILLTNNDDSEMSLNTVICIHKIKINIKMQSYYVSDTKFTIVKAIHYAYNKMSQYLGSVVVIKKNLKIQEM